MPHFRNFCPGQKILILPLPHKVLLFYSPPVGRTVIEKSGAFKKISIEEARDLVHYSSPTKDLLGYLIIRERESEYLLFYKTKQIPRPLPLVLQASEEEVWMKFRAKRSTLKLSKTCYTLATREYFAKRVKDEIDSSTC